jgi:hypothetical protein
MDSNFVLDYIRQRMKEMGHDNFHYEPVHVFSATPAKNITAYNEFYYLVTTPLPAGYRIISDVNSFDDTSSQLGVSGIQEFSGNIQITALSGTIDLEFIRVIVSKNFN